MSSSKIILSNNNNNESFIWPFGELFESFGNIVDIPQNGIIKNFSFFIKETGQDTPNVTYKAFIYTFDTNTYKVTDKLYESDEKTLNNTENYVQVTETLNKSVAVSKNDRIVIFFSTADGNGNDLGIADELRTYGFQYGETVDSEIFIYNSNKNWIDTQWSGFNNIAIHYELVLSKEDAEICFLAGSEVYTDQGHVKIEDIDREKHTIDGKKIYGLVKSYPTNVEEIVCVKKNAFEFNKPDKDLYMTRNHKVKFGGNFKRICRYMNEENKDEIFYVKYNGETLFSILLKNYGSMYVNNLKVETLHPKNKMAIDYLNN